MPADTQASYASCQQLQDSSCYCTHIHMCHSHFFLCTKSAQLTIQCFVCPVPLPVLSQGNGSVFLTQLSWQQSSGQRAGQKCSSYTGPHQGLNSSLPEPWKRVKAHGTDGPTPTEFLEKSNSAKKWRAKRVKRQKRGEKKWIWLELREESVQGRGPFVSTTQHTLWSTSIRISSESEPLYRSWDILSKLTPFQTWSWFLDFKF